MQAIITLQRGKETLPAASYNTLHFPRPHNILRVLPKVVDLEKWKARQQSSDQPTCGHQQLRLSHFHSPNSKRKDYHQESIEGDDWKRGKFIALKIFKLPPRLLYQHRRQPRLRKYISDFSTYICVII